MMMFNSTQKKLYEAWAQTVFKASNLITDTVGLGFRPVWQDMFNYIQKYIGFNNISKDAWILVLNDFDLTATKALREMGYYNIIMLVTDTTEEQTPTTYFFDVKFEDRKFKKLFPNGWSEIWKDVWFMSAVEVHNTDAKGKLLKSTHIEYKIKGDITKMKFDLIIANPPYGKIGAMITDKIRSDVSYTQYINLLPANDYKRVSNLHQYVRNMKTVQSGFADAAVTTHLCGVVKDANNMTVEEFEISQYIDPQLDKYFRENSTRAFNYALLQNTFSEEVVDSFFIPMRLSSGDHSGEHHFPYKKDCLSYKINNNQITYDDAAQQYASHYEYTGDAKGNYFAGNSIKFNTEVGKFNFAAFVYSKLGFKFVSKVLTSIHKDSRVPVLTWFPKVDWTRAWTVEEILADYGYTTDEIADVIADLKNFKDMERD